MKAKEVKEMTSEEELEVYHTKGHEVGSVSKRLRRVGAFEKRSASRAIMINNATKIAITHIDMFEGNEHIKSYEDFTDEAKAFLDSMKALSAEVYPHPELALVSTGPDMEDTLVL